MRKLLHLVAGGMTALALLAGAQPVSARTTLASAGNTAWAREAALCNGNQIVGCSVATSPVLWSMPLVFDATGSRTITVRGLKSNANDVLECQAVAITNQNTGASLSQVVSFPASSTISSVRLTLSSVPAGAAGVVYCRIGGSSYLTTVEYSP